METHIVTTVEDLESLQPEWEVLHARDPWASFYVTYQCVHAWATAYVEATELRIVTVRHNRALVGIAPLSVQVQRTKGRKRRVVRFASHGDYLTFLVDPGSPVSTVVKSLLTSMKETPADLINLGNVPVGGPLPATLLASPDNPHFTLHVESPIIDLTDYADFADFESRAVPAKTRKYRNKLMREHDVRWQVFFGSDASVLSRMGELHIREKQFLAGEQGRGDRHSLFEDEARRAHAAQLYVPGGDAVTFAYTDPDGAFLAYRSCYLHRRTLLSWNSAYAPELSDYRLGKVIQYDLMRHAFETDLADVFDFGAGRYPWKFEWTSRFRSTYRLRLDAPVREPQQSPAVRTEPLSAPPEPSATPLEQSATPPGTSEPAAGRPWSPLRRGLARIRGGGPPVTYVVSPHPDDETLRLTGYLLRLRGRIGPDHEIHLIAVSDGGGSAQARRLGWPVEREQEHRRSEQAAAFSALTGGRGAITRLGLADGHVTREDVVVGVRPLARRAARFVVAAHPEDYHDDHQAVVEAMTDLTGVQARFALSPVMKGSAKVFSPPGELMDAARIAYDAYAGFGQKSVAPEFRALRASGFVSRVVPC